MIRTTAQRAHYPLKGGLQQRLELTALIVSSRYMISFHVPVRYLSFNIGTPSSSLPGRYPPSERTSVTLLPSQDYLRPRTVFGRLLKPTVVRTSECHFMKSKRSVSLWCNSSTPLCVWFRLQTNVTSEVSQETLQNCSSCASTGCNEVPMKVVREHWIRAYRGTSSRTSTHWRSVLRSTGWLQPFGVSPFVVQAAAPSWMSYKGIVYVKPIHRSPNVTSWRPPATEEVPALPAGREMRRGAVKHTPTY